MKSSQLIAITAISLVLVVSVGPYGTEAGQGCPFDDGSCQEYCGQQGCQMGYCGHFAWIQCICRKCGDEWSSYDKVSYNPDKKVNQTELDSLKLNTTSNGNQQVQLDAPTVISTTTKAPESKRGNTLTLLLVPDLSNDNTKLDLNDIPDENSEKFLDYLANNHEKLVQATSEHNSSQDDSEESDSEDTENSKQQSNDADDMIEIQISTSNNITSGTSTEQPTEALQSSRQQPQPQPQQQVAVTSAPTLQTSSPVSRLLRMAVIERTVDEID